MAAPAAVAGCTGNDPLDGLCHFGMVIETLAFFQADITTLRIFVVFAAIVNAGYTLVDTEYNYTDCQFLWAIIQALVNLYRLAQTYYQYNQVKKSMTQDDMMVRDKVFSNYSLSEFKCVKDAWYQRTIPKGTKLMAEGEAVDDLKLIVSGKAMVSSLDENMYEVQQGNFVGELSFFTGNAASATITATSPISMVCWNKAELLKLMQAKGRDHKASAFQKMPHVLLGELSHTATALTSKLAQQTSKMREVEFDTSRWRMIASNLNQIVTNIATEEATNRTSQHSNRSASSLSRRASASSSPSTSPSTSGTGDGPTESDFSISDAAAHAVGAAAAAVAAAATNGGSNGSPVTSGLPSPAASNLKKCPTRSHQISRRTSSSTRSRVEAFTVARAGWQRNAYGGDDSEGGDDAEARKASMSAVRKLLGSNETGTVSSSVSRLTSTSISAFFSGFGGTNGKRESRSSSSMEGGRSTAKVTPVVDGSRRMRQEEEPSTAFNKGVCDLYPVDVSGDAHIAGSSFSHQHQSGNGPSISSSLDRQDSLDALIDICSDRAPQHGPKISEYTGQTYVQHGVQPVPSPQASSSHTHSVCPAGPAQSMVGNKVTPQLQRKGGTVKQTESAIERGESTGSPSPQSIESAIERGSIDGAMEEGAQAMERIV
jgi:CRP-like cAMP-binding protein